MKQKFLVKATNPNSNIIQIVFCQDQVAQAKIFAKQETHHGDAIPSGEIFAADGTVIERVTVNLDEQE